MTKLQLTTLRMLSGHADYLDAVGRDMRYQQANDVAVVLDPDGGEHVVSELSDSREGDRLFWCAGRVAGSIETLIERIWDGWYALASWDASYERAERSFTERFDV